MQIELDAALTLIVRIVAVLAIEQEVPESNVRDVDVWKSRFCRHSDGLAALEYYRLLEYVSKQSGVIFPLSPDSQRVHARSAVTFR